MATHAVSEPMTWKQICDRFPKHWVVLVEIDWVNDRDFNFRTARVAGAGETRRAPLDQARLLGYRSVGHFFTGPIQSLPLKWCL